MKRAALNEGELEKALQDLVGWQVQAGKLHKEFKFKSFATAMGWMVSVAIEADKLDHHPEWRNVYNKVVVDLVTHDLDNKVSTFDVELAKRMDALTVH
ncbi:MAG: 4a-hydroxytetrahydrobiopterin dehydratase [Chloroflexi bacterium]|nr:4a-hydroxytetrahydrobiopterin dehydratase [Chloroflexota bacterium]